MSKSIQQESQEIFQQEKTFKCLVCGQTLETMYEEQYILTGKVIGKNFSKEIKNAILCEYCACNVAEVEGV